MGDLRLATLRDAADIDELMKVSTNDIFPRFYDDTQTASAVIHIASVDRQLISDGTYFVIEEAGELVACGGWSKRDKLYTGSGPCATDDRLVDPATEPARVRAMFVRPDRTRRGLGTRILEACEDAARSGGFTTLDLMATLPGVLLYEHYGFIVIERTHLMMPDGQSLACVSMRKPVERVEEV
ncbi:MAG: GNAT family N-acetyltransferase [Candidatus Limnocylindrales bacterium]